MQKSGSVEITKDRVGFLTDPSGPGRANFKVDPGDVVRARAVVSTSGNILTRLTIYPSKGSGPIYDKGVVTEWVQGKNIPLSLEYKVPPGMKWVSVALDNPNWTPDEVPKGADPVRQFSEAQMTGTISWKNAAITVNRPLPGGGGGSTFAGFNTTNVMLIGGAAVAVGGLAYALS